MTSKKTLLICLIVFLPVIAFSTYVDARRHKSIKSLSKSSRSRADGSTSRKQSYLRIYSRPPKSVIFRENESDVLECRAGGSPPPVIHWLKDGEIIPETQLGILPMESEENVEWNKGDNPKLGISSTKSRLYLDCAQLKMSGKYTCVAENPYQRISSNTELTVVPSARQTISTHCTQKATVAKIPRIVTWSDKRLELMKNDVRLFCRANGHPKPAIEWLETEGQPVTQDPQKYQILANGDLIIHSLKWSDMGVYLCIASNIHGSDRIEAFLYPTAIEM